MHSHNIPTARVLIFCRSAHPAQASSQPCQLANSEHTRRAVNRGSLFKKVVGGVEKFMSSHIEPKLETPDARICASGLGRNLASAESRVTDAPGYITKVGTLARAELEVA